MFGLVKAILFLLLFRLGDSLPGSSSSVAYLEGDIIIGAIFPIHDKNGTKCGPLQFDDGIQPLEALFYTLDLINKNESLLPNITLGLIAVDSCDSPTHALDQSLIFIKGFLAHLNAFHAAEYFCPNNQASTFVGKFPSERVVGVIGGQNSAVSIQMAQLLKIFEIPQVSYLSTSPTLSNRVQFPYFYRTVPNDVTQAHAIMEILRHFNWSYVSLVYSDTEYSMKAHEKLTTMAPFYNVCFAAQYKVSYDCNASKYEEIAKKIISYPQSRVVILYTDKTYAARFFTAFKKMKRTWVDPFVFIGGDGWSARTAATHGNEAIMEGAIAVSPLARKIRGFEQYLRRLNPSTNKRNPWFGEFWQDYFRCYIQNESIPSSKSWSRPCQLGLDLKFRSISQVSFLHFVRDAAYVFAFALDSMHKDFCHGKPGLCEAMSHIDGIVLKNYIDNVSFTDESHWQFRFRDGGDGPPRYTVMNFQKDESDRYFWREIGTYFLTEQGIPLLNINMSIPRFRFYNKTFPPSVCNIYCDPKKGQLPHFKFFNTCCPKCRQCGEFDIIRNDQCEVCPWGQKPSNERGHCIPLEPEFMSYSNPIAISVMVICLTGHMITSFVSFIFWKHRETPIIKASGRELCAVLLSGISLSFIVPFIIVSKPNPWMCGGLRLFLGTTYSISFSAIATKTSRIARIFNQRKGGVPRARYTSPSSQLTIAALLASIEIVVNVCWLIAAPPTVVFIYPVRSKSILVCNGFQNMSFLVTLIYPAILLIFCTYYAVLTRKCPGVFSETRFIGLTVYTIVIKWMACITLIFSATSSTVRVVTLSVSMAASGVMQLACMFLPKVYIVLFRPEKNTREGVMSHQKITQYINSTNASIQAISNNNSDILRRQSNNERSIAEPTSSVYLAPDNSGFFVDTHSSPSHGSDNQAPSRTAGTVSFILGDPVSSEPTKESDETSLVVFQSNLNEKFEDEATN